MFSFGLQWLELGADSRAGSGLPLMGWASVRERSRKLRDLGLALVSIGKTRVRGVQYIEERAYQPFWASGSCKNKFSMRTSTNHHDNENASC